MNRFKPRLFFCILLLLSGSHAFAFLTNIAFWRTQTPAATPMVMSWNTSNTSAGSSAANQATLPLVSGATYNFVVNWGDSSTNTITTWNDAAKTHTYAAPGTYTITLMGRFDRLYFNNAGDRLKILDVTAWGGNTWTSMARMFYGCANLLISAADAPVLTSVTDMSGMFQEASSFNSNISTWNTGAVTNMSFMFYMASSFNSNIANWNTSAVTSMSYMFGAASAFNQNISLWNTASVTDMSGMFYMASSFNSNIANWNTSAVTNMSYMFGAASAFNQNISLWNTTSVTDMSALFFMASAFNQNISSWNTAAVTNMSSIFQSATNFNQDLSSWNVIAVGTNYPNYRLGANAWALPKPPGFP